MWLKKAFGPNVSLHIGRVVTVGFRPYFMGLWLSPSHIYFVGTPERIFARGPVVNK